MIFPWQEQQWQQLRHAQQANRLPHALLFSGIAGIGKAKFADCFAAALLCQQSSTFNPLEMKCSCHPCRLVAGRSHPNMMWIEPEKEGQAIKVDQIREAADFINQSSLQGEYRIVIINPADDMNVSAANALLKTLEEPPQGSLIILISHQYAHLPATILSRCQRIQFMRPEQHQAEEWLKTNLSDDAVNHHLLLQLANGAPLAALKLVKEDIFTLRQTLFDDLCLLSQQQADPIKSAANLQDIELLQCMDFLLSWLADVLRIQMDIDEIVNKDYEKQLLTLKQRIPLKNTVQLLEYVQQLRIQIGRGINFNKPLLLENVLIRWMECSYVSR